MMSEKTNKLRDLTTEELQRRLNEAREEMMNLRFQQSTGELSDLSRLPQVRRQIARLMTLLHERERMIRTEGE
ncbi:MAG: 50S ribosomal protein L29 [Anaerolineales bacterium]|nr:50S ribosomal protein L29 [Anaerolineales bacterium]